jgi:hypothetical protein
MNSLSLIRGDASRFAVPVESQLFSGHFYPGYPVVDLDDARDRRRLERRPLEIIERIFDLQDMP